MSALRAILNALLWPFGWKFEHIVACEHCGAEFNTEHTRAIEWHSKTCLCKGIHLVR